MLLQVCSCRRGKGSACAFPGNGAGAGGTPKTPEMETPILVHHLRDVETPGEVAAAVRQAGVRVRPPRLRLGHALRDGEVLPPEELELTCLRLGAALEGGHPRRERLGAELRGRKRIPLLAGELHLPRDHRQGFVRLRTPS